MRRRYVKVLSTLLPALVALISIAVPPWGSPALSSENSDSFKVILGCEVPEGLPSEMPLLRIIPEPLPIDSWLLVAREVFNMTGELELEYTQDPFYPSLFRELWISSKEASLIISCDGSFRWRRKNVNWHLEPLPSLREAKMMAYRVLKAIRRHDLIPDYVQVEFKDVFYSRWRYSTWQEGKPVGITVSYTIRLHGFPFYGHFSVDVNAQGVIGVCATWKFVEVDRSVEILPLDKALDRIADYMPRPKCPARIDKVIINEAVLGYAKLRDNPYIVPAYLLHATMVFENGESHDFHMSLPAVSEVPEA